MCGGGGGSGHRWTKNLDDFFWALLVQMDDESLTRNMRYYYLICYEVWLFLDTLLRINDHVHIQSVRCHHKYN